MGGKGTFFAYPMNQAMEDEFYLKLKHTLAAFLILITGQQETLMRLLLWLMG